MSPVKFLVALGALSLAASIHLACSSKSDSPSAEQACADLAKAQCAQVATCDSITMQLEWAGDPSQCAASLSASCMNVNSFPGHGTTPSSVEGCASATSRSTCAQYGVTFAECVPPAGTQANGSPCSIDAQCAGGACHSSGPGQCGTCTEKSSAPVTTCQLDSECAPGQICNGQCVAPGAAGAACAGGGFNGGCAFDLTCDFGDGGTAGTCSARANEGEPCVDSFGGTSFAGSCAAGLVCNGQTCVSPTWVPLGGACPSPGQPAPSSIELCAGGSCVGGTCVAYATVGSPCGTFQTPECAYGLVCSGGACMEPGNGVVCGAAGGGG